MDNSLTDTKKDMYEDLKHFVEGLDYLEEEEKNNFLNYLNNLSVGKIGDPNIGDSLDDVLEQAISQMEDDAIRAEDTEAINQLADMRNLRTEYQNQLLGLQTAGSDN